MEYGISWNHLFSMRRIDKCQSPLSLPASGATNEFYSTADSALGCLDVGAAGELSPSATPVMPSMFTMNPCNDMSNDMSDDLSEKP